MPRGQPGNKGGRPRKSIDWNTVEKLCSIQCTGEEIASVIGVDYDTLQGAIKREYGMSFSDYFDLKRGSGKASLRRMQWKSAEAGNPTMLIWLGKNYLNQSDRQSFEHTGKDGGAIQIDSPRDEINRRISGIATRAGKKENP